MPVYLCVNHLDADSGVPPLLVRAYTAHGARERAGHYTGRYAGWNCFRVTRTGMPRDKDIVVVNGRLEGAKVRLPPWQLFVDSVVLQAFRELGVLVTR